MHMRKWGSLAMITMLAASFVPTVASAQQWKDALDKVTDSHKQEQTDKTDHDGDAGQASAGLKEALSDGTQHAIEMLGQKGGFSDNAAVRIPLPGKLEQVGKLARKAGQGEKVDAFRHSLNRAAEKAVPEVADIFSDAISEMTLKDARGILTGGDHAATKYFRRTAGDKLAARIKPIVRNSTDEVGVTRKYKALTASSGGGRVTSALSRLGGDSDAMDLDAYVTDKTIDGLFTEIGKQESAIRHNPAERGSKLLQQVFGDN